MHPKLKLFASLFAILLIAAAAVWISLPQGSKISLKNLKFLIAKSLRFTWVWTCKAAAIWFTRPI